LVGDGTIAGALPPVVNPISGRSLAVSFIGSWSPFPRNMAHVMLRRLAARWNSDEITDRSWAIAVPGAAGAAVNR
jgi:hypothetical protein